MPWSTQYGDDFNKRYFNKTSSFKRKYPKNSVVKWNVPRATELNTSTIERPYVDGTYGLEDPMMDACHVTFTGYGDDLLEKEPVLSEPITLDPSPEHHWICWPEAKQLRQSRPHTSLGFVRNSHRVSNSFIHRDEQGVDSNRIPVKQIDFETSPYFDKEHQQKDAMYEFGRSHSFYEPSQKPMTSVSLNNPLPRDSYTLYSRYSKEPWTLNIQPFPLYHKQGDGTRQDGMALQQELGDRIKGIQRDPFTYNYSFNKYPLHMRRNRLSAAAITDYVHEQSTFMRTSPPCVGHFIIHPDWVSERFALRRSNTMLPTGKGGNQRQKY